jgi:ATP-dependent protease ClpP protease subunit
MANAPDRIYLVFTLGISPQSVQKLLTECANWANQGTKEIYLLYASAGGTVAAGIAAYNALRSLPVKLITQYWQRRFNCDHRLLSWR